MSEKRSFADYPVAREMRDTIKKIARKVVKEEVPSIKMGKVFSVDRERQLAWVLFPGETVDNLVKVRCAADRIPTQYMETRFETDGYEAPGDIVRVWGQPGSLFVLDFYSGLPSPTLNAAGTGIYLIPEMFGAVGNGIVDDTFAVQLCIDTAADTKGGAIVYLKNVYAWRGDLFHRGGVEVIGNGNPKYLVDETDNKPGQLLALDGTARYRYGTMGDGTGSANDNPGPLRDLTINGDYVGGATELFRMEAVDSMIQNVHVIRSAPGGVTWAVRGSQNGTILQCLMGYSPGAIALQFYNSPGQGAGMMRFTNCYMASSGKLMEASADPANFVPHDIQFDNCLFEIYSTAMGSEMVNLFAGEFQFKSCIFTNSNAATIKPPSNALILVTNDVWPTISTTATFSSCYFNGGVQGLDSAVRVVNSDLLTHAANVVRFKGRGHVNNVKKLVTVDGGGIIGSAIVTNDADWYRGTQGNDMPAGTRVSWIEAINGAYLFNYVKRVVEPHRVELPADTTGTLLPAWAMRFDEIDLGDRLRLGLTSTGEAAIYFSDGSSGTPTKGSIFYDRPNDLMGIGGQVRYANTFGMRVLPAYVTGTAQPVELSAARTAGPAYVIVFQLNGASAALSIDDSGIDGQWLEIYLFNPGITGNTVTWPSIFHFPGGRDPQPLDNSCVVVTVRKIAGEWYGNGEIRNEVIDDRVAALLQEGANVDLTYDDAANQLTIAVPNENIDDRVAALLQEGSNIDITYDDAAGTLTISGTGTPGEVIDDRVAALIQNGTNLIWTYDDTANTLTAQVSLDTDGTLAANSDTKIASQKAVKTYADRLRVVGTTATGAGTAAKVVTIAGYVPAAGDVLILTLTAGNSAALPTVNINAGGAKNVMLGGAQPTAASALTTAGGQWIMRYDGTSWHMMGVPANYSGSSQAAMEAGTGTSHQYMSPLHIKQAIDFHATRKILEGSIPVTASTAAKTVTLTGYTLRAGDVFALTLTNGNTSDVPTLNVNSTGALPITQGATNASFQTAAGKVWFLYYTGTGFILLSGADPVQSWIDTDVALAANSDLKIATQKAVKAYVDGILDANNAYQYKGVIDCSANPNYPAASAGHTYKVSVAGKIGGASGPNVEVGDSLTCLVDGSAAGTHAAVGGNWIIIQTNIDGAVVGPAASVAGNIVSFSGSTGKVIQDSGMSFDTDGTLAANSDTRLATQKAVKTYADTKQPLDATLTALAGTNPAAADKFIITTGADAFALADVTPAARTVLDDASIEAMRATLQVARTVSGTIGTGVGTAAKTVTLSGYTLTAGDYLALTLTNGNTSLAPTLNVNAGGAVALQQTGPTPAFETAAGGTWLLYYTGSTFILLNTHDPVDAVFANKINSGFDVFARDFITGEAILVSQRMIVSYFTCDKIFTASQIRTVTGSQAASGATTIKLGLFQVNSDLSLTLLAKTANNTALWAATDTVYTEPFESGGTVAMVRNQRYAMAVLQDGGTMAKLVGQRSPNGNILTYTPRLVGDISGQTDIVGPVTPTGVARDRPWGVILP